MQTEKWWTLRAFLIFAVGIGSLVALNLQHQGWLFGLSIYGTIAVTYLLSKLVASAA